MPHKVTLADEDFFDDGMDDPLSTYPTSDYAAPEDEYEEEETPAAPVFHYAGDAQRRKETAAETRRGQREAEIRRAGNAAEDAERALWLARRGFTTEGFDAETTRRLFDEMHHNETVRDAELNHIAAVVPRARAMLADRRAHVSGERVFFLITVAWTYPSGGDSVQVESNNAMLRGAVNNVLQHSAKRNSEGFLTLIGRLLGALCDGPEAQGSPEQVAVAVCDAWRELTDETIPPRSGGRKIEVTVPPVDHAALAAARAQREQQRAAQSRRMQASARRAAAAIERQTGARHSTFAAAVAAYQSPVVPHQDGAAVSAPATHMERTSAAVASALSAKMATAHENGWTSLTFANSPLLAVVPPAIGRLTDLQVLDLSNCGLSNLPNLGRMRLQKLYLAHNNFDIIPETVYTGERQQSLRILDLSFNRIDAIPAAMAQLTSLEILQLDYNRVRALCDVSKWERLEVLEITDNALRVLPVEIARLPRLWRLRIGANPLENVPVSVFFQGIEKVKQFLTELTPGNLPVPKKTIAHDVVAQHSKAGAPDLAVYVPSCARCVYLASYLVEARLPGLLAKTSVPSDPAAGVIAEVIVHADLNSLAVDCLVSLLLGSGSAELSQLADDPVAQVGLSTAIAEFGTPRLNQQLAACLRGHSIDADEVLGSELEQLSMRAVRAALVDDGGAPPFAVGDLITVVVGPLAKRFVVHRRLLRARVAYFENMFASGLEEADAAELRLEDVDADVFAAFLAFLYSDSASKLTPDNVVALLFLAVEWDVPRLRGLAEAMVGYNVDTENVAQVIQLAYFLNAEKLKNACMFFVCHNHAAVRATEAFHQLQDTVKKELADKLATWQTVLK